MYILKVHDAASLLSGAGFNLIGVDVDDVVVKYKNAWELIQHLRVRIKQSKNLL